MRRQKPIHWRRYPLDLPMCYHPNESEVDPDKVFLTDHRSNVTCKKCERIMAREYAARKETK